MVERATKIISAADDDEGEGADAVLDIARPSTPQPGKPDLKTVPAAEEFEAIEVGDDGKTQDERQGTEEPEDQGEEAREADASGDQRRPKSLAEKIAEEEREANALGISRQAFKKRKRNARFRERGEENSRLRGELAAERARIADLESKVKGFEPRLSEIDAGRHQDRVRQLDADIALAETALSTAEDAFVTAMEANDGQAAKRALRARDDAFVKKERLAVQKTNLDAAAKAPRTEQADGDDRRQGTQQRQEQAPRALSPQAQAHANDFLTTHSWINPRGSDADSRMAIFWDRELQLGGSDPTTAEHWEKLEEKLEEVMPHRFEEEDAPRKPSPKAKANGNGAQPRQQQAAPERRGPMTTGSSERPAGGNGARKQVRLTPERIKALQSAGVMDDNRQVVDKARFQKIAKGYDEWDRTHSSAVQ